MSLERMADFLVTKLTKGCYGVQESAEFREEIAKITSEKRDLATRFYDAGTQVIIDDENHRLLTKYQFVRKK